MSFHSLMRSITGGCIELHSMGALACDSSSMLEFMEEDEDEDDVDEDIKKMKE